MPTTTNLKLVCAIAATFSIGAAWGQSTEEEDLAMVYGDKSFVTIATGTRVPLSRAPAVASVITAEDIKALGATDLDEVLETVPGLHVSRSTQGYAPVYQIRGIHRDVNPQVLMLVNGIPMTTVFQGNRGNIWAGLPLENVARIEVIRGPGSALYGADAFAGVINITTKTAGDIDGTQFGARFGSFNTQDAWMLHGGSLGPLEVAGYLRVGTTDGQKKTITRDAVGASGPLSLGRDAVDGALDLSHGNWRFRAGYKERDHVGSAEGAAQALDPTGHSYSERLTSDLTYQNSDLAQNWDVTLQGSYMGYKEFSDLVLFPPGGAFTGGMIGNPYKWEKHGRFNASALYHGFDAHRLRMGTGAQKDEVYKTRETKNFNPDFSAIGTGSLADVTDVSGTDLIFLKPHSRTVRYWFLQDEWNFSKDWTLTAGVRRDNYSDVGNTTNPRLALAWEAAYNVTAKLLYGSAFRAPSFVELYTINNPVQIGNPGLQPERIRTLEAALSWQPAPTLHLGANLFGYRMTNTIQLDAAKTYRNAGEQTGKGMEFEAAWDVSREVRLSGNYSHQKSIDKATNQDAGYAPHDRIYLRTDWRFTPGWAFNAQINAVGKREREAGDTRAALRGYTTVDMTLRTDRGAQQWNVAVSARNLFNADVREPSPLGSPTSIPNDFPLAGRSIYLQAEYKL